MKLNTLALIALCLAPLTSFAATSWQCDGITIEGLSVTEAHGKLTGFLSWDCFPGDGICNQDAAVQVSTNSDGNTEFKGPHFYLLIETSKNANSAGEYPAHISATDMTDASDEGRGFTMSESAACKKGE